jgi:hypothetical protein
MDQHASGNAAIEWHTSHGPEQQRKMHGSCMRGATVIPRATRHARHSCYATPLLFPRFPLSPLPMFNPSRDEVRQFFTDTWRKQRAGEILTPLESIAADWIGEHPEYQQELADPESKAADYSPERGQTNPFLHLSMHLAISEQLSIDQPPGIRRAHERLVARLGSTHDAQHAIMECLGQIIWDTQRNNVPPDTDAYLALIERRASRD